MSDPNVIRTGAPASCLDLKVIEALRDLGGADDPGLLVELIDVFLKDSPERVEGVDAAVRNQDAEGLAAAAHGLKSSAANMGASRVSKLCRTLEAMGRGNDLQGAAELLQELKAEFSLVESAFEEIRSRE
ncbi:MAG: Hpt domain-containing protein [Planctomycetota bacterium]